MTTSESSGPTVRGSPSGGADKTLRLWPTYPDRTSAMCAKLTTNMSRHLFPDDLNAVADAFDTAADALRTVGVFKPVVVGTNSP